MMICRRPLPSTGHGGGDGSRHLLTYSALGHQLLPLLILQLHQLNEGMSNGGICMCKSTIPMPLRIVHSACKRAEFSQRCR